MANDNETVEQVLERMTRGMGRDCSVECQLLESDVVEYAERILTAHNREIEAKDRQLESASADAEAADAEIDKLKFDNMRLKSEQRTAAECIIEQTNKVEEKDAEIARLRTLVKGLLDASSISCAECKYDCYSDHSNCIIHEAANYIKKGEVEND